MTESPCENYEPFEVLEPEFFRGDKECSWFAANENYLTCTKKGGTYFKEVCPWGGFPDAEVELMSEPLSFVDENGEEFFAPEGCDGLCRLDCEVYGPEHEYCKNEVCEPIEPDRRLVANVKVGDVGVDD